jgi:hypothetical protein
LFSWGDAKHCLTELSQEKTIFPVGPVKGDRQACGTARGRNALRVRRNFLPANDGNGIVVVDASLISASVMNLNGKKPGAAVNTASDGIELGARNRVLNCTIFSNGQHGVFSASANNRNFIEGCLLHSNAGFAIFLESNGNSVVRNQVGGNTSGTINQSGGNIAPIQNASTAVGSLHPLANYP